LTAWFVRDIGRGFFHLRFGGRGWGIAAFEQNRGASDLSPAAAVTGSQFSVYAAAVAQIAIGIGRIIMVGFFIQFNCEILYHRWYEKKNQDSPFLCVPRT